MISSLTQLEFWLITTVSIQLLIIGWLMLSRITPIHEYSDIEALSAKYDLEYYSNADLIKDILIVMGYEYLGSFNKELNPGTFTYHEFYNRYKIVFKTKYHKFIIDDIVKILPGPTKEQLNRRELHRDKLLSSGATNNQ